MSNTELSQWRDQTPDPVWNELQRLKAELARLTPSGQAAEDERVLRQWLVDGMDPEGGRYAALSRLATKAKAERDAAIARTEEAEKQARLAWERHAEKDEAYGGMIAQRDAAVADNAALLRRIGDIQSMVFSLRVDGHEGDEETGVHEPDCGRCARNGIEAAVADALSGPHLGAALLKERQNFHACLDAIETAVVETVGGKVEGAPVSRINYLQRLRELVIIEQAFVALSRLRAGDAAEQARQSETIKALEGALTTIAERGVSSTDRRIARDALHLAGRLP